MTAGEALNLKVDRLAKMTLESGVLEPGARLPSWQDLPPARRRPGYRADSL